MKTLNIIALTLVIIGALNWGLIGIMNFNLVDSIFGIASIWSRTIYVLVGLDNLSIRKDFNKFDVGCKYTSLKKYIAEDRAFYKIDAIDKNSIFAFNLKKFMNNHLRNMIGHCSYEINNITQIVKYKNGQKTLVEITYYCYQLILELLNSFCIVTLLHELYLLYI